MTEGTTPETETDTQALHRKAYGQAMTRLRDEFTPRFHELRTEEAAKLGLTWTAPESPLDKARKELDALLAAHPELRSEIAS